MFFLKDYYFRHFIASLFASMRSCRWTVEAPQSQKILSRQHEDVRRLQVEAAGIYQSASPSVHQFVCLFFYQSISLPVHQSVSLSVHQSVCLSLRPSISLLGHPSINMSVGQSICPSLHQSVCLSVHPSISPSAHQSVSLSVRLRSWSCLVARCPLRLRT